MYSHPNNFYGPRYHIISDLGYYPNYSESPTNGFQQVSPLSPTSCDDDTFDELHGLTMKATEAIDLTAMSDGETDEDIDVWIKKENENNYDSNKEYKVKTESESVSDYRVRMQYDPHTNNGELDISVKSPSSSLSTSPSHVSASIASISPKIIKSEISNNELEATNHILLKQLNELKQNLSQSLLENKVLMTQRDEDKKENNDLRKKIKKFHSRKEHYKSELKEKIERYEKCKSKYIRMQTQLSEQQKLHIKQNTKNEALQKQLKYKTNEFKKQSIAMLESHKKEINQVKSRCDKLNDENKKIKELEAQNIALQKRLNEISSQRDEYKIQAMNKQNQNVSNAENAIGSNKRPRDDANNYTPLKKQKLSQSIKKDPVINSLNMELTESKSKNQKLSKKMTKYKMQRDEYKLIATSLRDQILNGTHPRIALLSESCKSPLQRM